MKPILITFGIGFAYIVGLLLAFYVCVVILDAIEEHWDVQKRLDSWRKRHPFLIVLWGAITVLTWTYLIGKAVQGK